MKRRLALTFALVAGCAGGDVSRLPEYPPFLPDPSLEEPTEAPMAEPERTPPPESGPATDVRFPARAERTLPSGLVVDVVDGYTLPVVHVALVVRSGLASDPANRPGLASFVADMLREGTRRKTSAQLAAAFDDLGIRYSVSAGAETTTISLAMAEEQLDAGLALLAEMVTEPRFDAAELEKLRRRERDRLRMADEDPNVLARRAVRAELYGPQHPYGHFDATLASVDAVTRDDLVAFHRAHYVGGNANLVVVGRPAVAAVLRAAERHLGRLPTGSAPALAFPEARPRTDRQIVVVDRPGSVQTVIRVANVAIARNDADYVPLSVANHVLGGGANARLFVDLREQRGLTYGAYSSVGELRQPAPFAVATAVRTAVTTEALSGIFDHLRRMTTEPVPEDELTFASRYLSDSFPLQIDTPAKIVSMIVDQRFFGLPTDVWDTYRTQVREVTAEQALAVAQRAIRPDQSLVVLVGESSAFVDALPAFGPVRVVDPAGTVLRELPDGR